MLLGEPTMIREQYRNMLSDFANYEYIHY